MSTSIFDAIRKGELETVKNLLSQNPEYVKQKDARGSTPLLLATYYGNEQVTSAILELPQDLDAIAKLLIDYGANVNVKNNNGATALTYATMFKKINIITLLLEHGADKTIKDDSGKTALDHAVMHGMKEAIDLLQ